MKKYMIALYIRLSLEDAKTDSMSTVSYTHLDVYKRQILYSARKWKKTLLVFFLLLAITTLVLSGLAIADAQEEQAEELRGVTAVSYTQLCGLQ